MRFESNYIEKENIVIVKPLEKVDFELCVEMVKGLTPYLYDNPNTSFFFDYYTHDAELISYDDLKLITEYFKTFAEHLDQRKLAFYTIHNNHKQNMKSWIAMLITHIGNFNIKYFDDLQKASDWLNYDLSYLYKDI